MPNPFVVHPPLTTLVRLTGIGDFSLADDLARNELGLPPKFEINHGAAPTAEPLARAVAKPVVTALKATPATADYSATEAIAKDVAAFPGKLTTLPVLRSVPFPRTGGSRGLPRMPAQAIASLSGCSRTD